MSQEMTTITDHLYPMQQNLVVLGAFVAKVTVPKRRGLFAFKFSGLIQGGQRMATNSRPGDACRRAGTRELLVRLGV